MTFDGIRKSYGRVTALESADFSVRAGEVFSIVGETGSGKTTLAMIAAGALQPDSGKRTFKGRDIADWLSKDRLALAGEVGIIYQNPSESVSHRFRVFDIVAEPLRIQKKTHRPFSKENDGESQDDEERRRVLKAMTDVHLPVEPDFLQRYPHELNMGAIQRLCIARALVHDPALIVADEPTSALDPSVQAKVVKMLLDLQTEKGLTMIFVTHDIGLARKISDRICVMLAGRIVELGPAAKVIGEPGHPYTKGLLDSARGSHFMKNALRLPGQNTDSPPRPSGCPFADRCERRTDQCLTMDPPRVDLEERFHCVRCFHPLR
jgi:peptide/nickel transport system ATP-binding protein